MSSSSEQDLSQGVMDLISEFVDLPLGMQSRSTFVTDYTDENDGEGPSRDRPLNHFSLQRTLYNPMVQGQGASQPLMSSQSLMSSQPLMSSQQCPPLIHHPTSPLSHTPSTSPSSCQLQSPTFSCPPYYSPPNPWNILSNTPELGEYGFTLKFESEEKRQSKNINVTYSEGKKQLYVKPGCTVPFNFSFTKLPPDVFEIHACCIYKVPAVISTPVACCAKHVEELRRKGYPNPNHFIRCAEDDKCLKGGYFHDVSGKWYVTLPIHSLQPSSKLKNTRVALYEFPCYTSELPRQSRQQVQIIFSLISPSEKLTVGRCVVDVRVCASPGRDKSMEENKMANGSSSSSLEPSRKRMRSSSHSSVRVTEGSHRVTIPPVPMMVSGKKVDSGIQTYPAFVPFLKTVAELLESLHTVPTPEAGVKSEEDEATSVPGLLRQNSFGTLESWLDSLDLLQYKDCLMSQGVNALFQVNGVTEEELKKWGMKNSEHRKKFMEGKKLIPVAEEVAANSSFDSFPLNDTPPLFTSSQQVSSSQHQVSSQSLPLSQISSTSSISHTQPFEVVQVNISRTEPL